MRRNIDRVNADFFGKYLVDDPMSVTEPRGPMPLPFASERLIMKAFD
jgi:hypothetical protein